MNRVNKLCQLASKGDLLKIKELNVSTEEINKLVSWADFGQAAAFLGTYNALMLAASNGHVDVVKYLLEEKNADISIKGGRKKDFTALDCAKNQWWFGPGINKDLVAFMSKWNSIKERAALAQALRTENPRFTPEQWIDKGKEFFNPSNGKTKDYIRAKICFKQAIIFENTHELAKIHLFMLNQRSLDNANAWNKLGDNYFFEKNEKNNGYQYAKWCYKIALMYQPSDETAIKNLEILSNHEPNNSPCTVKTQEYYEEAMSPTSDPKGQKLILEDIINSKEVAGLKFKGGKNWLHILSRLPFSELVEQAINQIITAGIDIYSRDPKSETPFFNTAPNNSKEMMELIRPGDFIGVDTQINSIRTFLETIKKNPHNEQHLLLVSGPPGVGKTELTRTIIKQQGYTITKFITGKKDDRYVNQLETRIIEFFEKLKKATEPTCVYMDEIDAMLPSSDNASKDMQKRIEAVVTQFQTSIDELKGTKIVIIGATNYYDRIKDTIKSRGGNCPVIFKLPNKDSRQLLVQDFLRFHKLESNSTIIQSIVNATSGWSPRDLKNYFDKVKNNQSPPNLMNPILDETFVACFNDFREAWEQKKTGHARIIAPKLKKSTPHERAMPLITEVLSANDTICDFIENPALYKKVNKNYKVHTLLSGPPGTGKTDFAALVVEKSNCPCFIIEPGLSLQTVSDTFSRAKACERAIIFIDEFDKYTSEFSSTRELIQTEMDGFNKSDNTLVVIAATNYLDRIAKPVLSRFGQKIALELPNTQQREKFITASILKLFADDEIKLKFKPDQSLQEEIDLDCKNLAREMDGFSIRDIQDVMDGLTPVLIKYIRLTVKSAQEEPFIESILKLIHKIKLSKEETQPPSFANYKSTFFAEIQRLKTSKQADPIDEPVIPSI